MTTIGIILAVFSAIAGIVGASYSTAAQQQANSMNQKLNEENREDQQQFSQEAQQQSVRDTEYLYNTLYSPAAKVKQLQQAGLSVGMMYGQGGMGGSSQAAPMAATPSNAAPVMNPTINMGMMSEIGNLLNAGTNPLKTITEAEKTKEESKNEEKRGREIEANIAQIMQNTKKLEEETKTEVVTRNYQQLQVELADNELKYQNATLKERIEIVKENLKLLENNNEKTREEIEGLNIDNSYKAKMYDSQLELNEETKKKIIQEQLEVAAKTELAKAQEALAKAQEKRETEQANYINKQAQELQKKLDQIKIFGWKAVNSNGWVDAVIGMIEELETKIWQYLEGDEKEGDGTFRGFGKEGGFEKGKGGGGKW